MFDENSEVHTRWTRKFLIGEQFNLTSKLYFTLHTHISLSILLPPKRIEPYDDIHHMVLCV